MKISVHIHSAQSMDARQPVRSILEESRRLGYDAVAITDHNTVAGSREAEALRPDSMKSIIGAEFSTEKGHILALFIDERVEQDCRKLGEIYAFDDLVSRVRAQDGLLFLAHPLQSEAVSDPSFIAALDGFELVNARVSAGPRERRAKRLGEQLCLMFPDKVWLGGSDAHTGAELKSVYMTSSRTDVRDALLHPDDIYWRPSRMTLIRLGNIVSNRKRHLRFYLRQIAALAFGLFYDGFKKLTRGNSYDVIRVRAETQQGR